MEKKLKGKPGFFLRGGGFFFGGGPLESMGACFLWGYTIFLFALVALKGHKRTTSILGSPEKDTHVATNFKNWDHLLKVVGHKPRLNVSLKPSKKRGSTPQKTHTYTYRAS